MPMPDPVLAATVTVTGSVLIALVGAIHWLVTGGLAARTLATLTAVADAFDGDVRAKADSMALRELNRLEQARTRSWSAYLFWVVLLAFIGGSGVLVVWALLHPDSPETPSSLADSVGLPGQIAATVASLTSGLAAMIVMRITQGQAERNAEDAATIADAANELRRPDRT
ncbi:hypothetical protein [Micrococcus luteus]|uniref:hypothetical protein n=2 Tax=Micrococcus luteus TaxID=1270 RepID=UPI001E55F8D9|nr:hypothetical protein [Micrococcus luteus]